VEVVVVVGHTVLVLNQMAVEVLVVVLEQDHKSHPLELNLY
jgi:hypothetical protein